MANVHSSAGDALAAAALAAPEPTAVVQDIADGPAPSSPRSASDSRPATSGDAAVRSPASHAYQPSRAVDETRAGRRTSVVGSRRTGRAAVTDFFYGTLLGEGAFARVLHAAHRDSGAEYAVKIVEKRQIARQDKRDSVMMERNVMGAARHHCVTRLVYTFQTRDELFFAMDLCRGRDLFAAIRRFRDGREEGARGDGTLLPLPLCRFYMAQCVCALEYLHTRLGVVHLDFKPENVLLSERGHVKLADFGTAKAEPLASRITTAHLTAAAEIARTASRASSLSPGEDGAASDAPSEGVEPPEITDEHRSAARRHASVVLAAALDRSAAARIDALSRDDRSALQFVGTAEYVSPEMVAGEEPHGAADLWALGCTLFQMAVGVPPFTGPNEYAILQAAGDFAAGTQPLPWPDGVPADVRDLTEALMRAEPAERLGARGLVGIGEGEEEGGASPAPGGGYAELKAHPFFEGVDWSEVGTEAAAAPWVPPRRELAPPSSPSPLSWESLGEEGLAPAPAPSAAGAGSAAAGDGLRIARPAAGESAAPPSSQPPRAAPGCSGRASASPETASGTTPRHPIPPAEPAPVPPTGGHGWVTGEALSAAQLTSLMDSAGPGAPLPRECWSSEYWAPLLPAGHSVLMFGRVGKKRGWLSRTLERDVVLVWVEDGASGGKEEGKEREKAEEAEEEEEDDVVVSPSRPAQEPTSAADQPAPALPAARLLYFDPSRRRQKGEIVWDDDMAVACSDEVRWTLTCASGVYQMWDWAGRAELWARALRGAVSRRLQALDRHAARHRRASLP